ncbi:vWA domain-containing protein [Methylocaldum sp.]|uniref:vWA domain-containing protein n=1 Tax=Methylocaldum sp. TaxID=1969727 RepID=UPI002D682DAB|nr:vWA domain-containing protein [Methylocaldum sp.]HYE37760.1 vWA domain-containing protein [Methylocaldum sp.]
MDHRAGFSAGLALKPSIRARDPRFICLALALLSVAAALFRPTLELSQAVFDHIVVVDITRSMSVADYRVEGRPTSRLESVKSALRSALRELPCGSRLGLGLFTERRSFLLFEPIEVCSGFDAVDTAIERIDWRMAWGADSRIADGLYDALSQFQNHGSNLIFVTDGQEAPPINRRYKREFGAFKGKLKGLIIGAGGLTPVPIPKFDERGEAIGFYSEDEVPHRSSFGLPPKSPSEIEGYHERNAPFGSERVIGTEHLSALREDYLRQLADETGLFYWRLEKTEELSAAMKKSELARFEAVAADIRWLPGGFALVALIVLYGVLPFRLR